MHTLCLPLIASRAAVRYSALGKVYNWARFCLLSKMSTTTLPLPFPRAHGPRLEPFRGAASADVEFLAFLGNDKDVDSKVWKVRIDKNIYALKIVSRAPASHLGINTVYFPLNWFSYRLTYLVEADICLVSLVSSGSKIGTS